jgi:hypothetical protein
MRAEGRSIWIGVLDNRHSRRFGVGDGAGHILAEHKLHRMINSAFAVFTLQTELDETVHLRLTNRVRLVGRDGIADT